MKKIFILTALRQVGGSGTECIHLADLFHQKGYEVHISTNLYGDKEALEWAKSIGCIIHTEQDYAYIKGYPVVIHGNSHILMKLAEIKKAQPSKIIYISPMWHPSNVEQQALRYNLIDDLIHVSNAQRNHHLNLYKQWNTPHQPLRYGYIPYINPDNTLQKLTFNYKEIKDYVGIGRIARPDPPKYNADLWHQMDLIKTPQPKHVFINSWDNILLSKVGNPPPNKYEITLYQPYAINISHFLDKVHLIVQAQGGSGESYGRYVLEAMLKGVPCILENNTNNAFTEIATPNIHYLHGKTTTEMADAATDLLQHTDKIKEIALNACNHIRERNGNIDYCWNFWKDII